MSPFLPQAEMILVLCVHDLRSNISRMRSNLESGRTVSVALGYRGCMEVNQETFCSIQMD